MTGLLELIATNPFWGWLALGAVLLIAEAVTGSGWLLWPAVASGVTAVLILTGLIPNTMVQIGLFAALTLGATLLAKPWTPRPMQGADLNDRAQRVLGQTAEAKGDFVSGRGRVFVDGAEWPAELEGGGALASGELVKVVKVESARLVVGRA